MAFSLGYPVAGTLAAPRTRKLLFLLGVAQLGFQTENKQTNKKAQNDWKVHSSEALLLRAPLNHLYVDCVLALITPSQQPISSVAETAEWP